MNSVAVSTTDEGDDHRTVVCEEKDCGTPRRHCGIVTIYVYKGVARVHVLLGRLVPWPSVLVNPSTMTASCTQVPWVETVVKSLFVSALFSAM